MPFGRVDAIVRPILLPMLFLAQQRSYLTATSLFTALLVSNRTCLLGLLTLRLWQDRLVHFVLGKLALSDQLSEFKEVYRVFTRDLSCVESLKSKKSFIVHIRCKPVSVVVFGLVPEKLLFSPYAVNCFYETAWKEIRKQPVHLVHFSV